MVLFVRYGFVCSLWFWWDCLFVMALMGLFLRCLFVMAFMGLFVRYGFYRIIFFVVALMGLFVRKGFDRSVCWSWF